MKTNLLKHAACAVLILSVFNCSVEPVEQLEQFTLHAQSSESTDETDCEGALPIARIVNSGTVNVNFAIYNSDLELLNSEHNIAADDTSSWLSFDEGTTLFVVSFIDMKGEKIQQVAELCTSIEFFINSENVLSVNDVTSL